MTAPNRKREVQVNFRVSQEELELIEQKMSQLGTANREAYLRKMALDGYVVKLELPELKELVSLLRRSSNNLNQLTRRVHRRAASTTPTWTTCGKAMPGWGRRQTKSSPRWQLWNEQMKHAPAR